MKNYLKRGKDMKNKKIRRLLAVLLIGIMLISSMSALAEEKVEKE